MIKLTDGPADGLELEVRRAPLFLRVALTPAGSYRGLTEQDDRVRPGETVTVYRREGRFAVKYRRAKRERGTKAGYFAEAHYRCLVVQPADAHTTENAAWRAWCVDAAAVIPGKFGGVA